MINVYKLTTAQTKGALYVSYNDGFIKEALFSFDAQPSPGALEFLGIKFPFFEQELSRIGDQGWSFQALKPRTTSDKLAMFCIAFRNYRTTTYTPKKYEKANIAGVMMSPQLLDAYFTNADFPLTYAKSISDYVKHYNYIRDLAANGKPLKTGFPDVYDREYERTLEGEKLSMYWQHLNKKGWKKVDGVWTNSKLQ